MLKWIFAFVLSCVLSIAAGVMFFLMGFPL